MTLDELSDTLQQRRKIPPKNHVEISHRSPGEISPYSDPPSSPIAESIPHRILPNLPVISQTCELSAGSNGLTKNPVLRFELKSIGGGQFALTPIFDFNPQSNVNFPHNNHQINNIPSQGSKENCLITGEKIPQKCIQSKEVNLPTKVSTQSSSKVNTRSKKNPPKTKTKKTPPPRKRPQKSVRKGVKKKAALPNELEEDLSQGIAHDSDTNSISSVNECAIVSRPFRTSTPSVAETIVNGNQNTQIVPSPNGAHRCPCNYSLCSIRDGVLPQNQTLLTQFFKSANGTKSQECTVLKLEQLDASSEPLKINSVSKNNKPDSEVNHISSHTTAVRKNGFEGKCSIRTKLTQEELFIDYTPLHYECNGQVDEQSSDELSCDDQLSQNYNHDKEPLDTDISNKYNNDNHTLSSILSKLQCLLIVNTKRRELLRHRSNQLFKLKSDLAWKIRAKLFKEIEDVERMLPSMPNLIATSKSGLEGPDESSLQSGVPTPGPDEHTEFIEPEIQSDVKKVSTAAFLPNN